MLQTFPPLRTVMVSVQMIPQIIDQQYLWDDMRLLPYELFELEL